MRRFYGEQALLGYISTCRLVLLLLRGRGAWGSWPTVALVPKKNSTLFLPCLTLSHYSLLGGFV